MGIGASLAIYFIIWWLTFFTVLPVGATSQAESGDITAGTEPGAPVSPNLIKKAIWTTGISLVVFGLVYAAIEFVEL